MEIHTPTACPFPTPPNLLIITHPSLTNPTTLYLQKENYSSK